jgi:hypothetical protein
MTGNGKQSSFDKSPPRRAYDFIRADDASTHRLPPLAKAGAEPSQGINKKLRIGTVRAITPPLSFPAAGKCFDLGEDGDDIVLAIVSADARQVRVHFEQVMLPVGAKIFVSSLENSDEFYGPYEGRGPSGDGSFWTPPVEGDGVLIEYYRPRSISGMKGKRANFQVTEIGHTYRR